MVSNRRETHEDRFWDVSFIFLVLTSVMFLESLFIVCSQANAGSPITPSGLNTRISGPIAGGGQTQYNITGGTRSGGGQNLFHGFGNFSVGAGDIANFLNTPVNGSLPFTSNILGRITGRNTSNIYGTIQTTGFEPGSSRRARR